MGKEKKVPVIGLNNLVPPYRDYPFFTFGDEPENRLKVGDARHGLGLGAPKAFSLADAWWLAEASMLTFDDQDTVVPRTLLAAGFDEVRLVDCALDTQVFVAVNARHAVAIFRGTESSVRAGTLDFEHVFLDLATDAKFRRVAFDEADARKGRVHRGFKGAVDAEGGVWRELSAHLLSLNDGRRAFWFTGHSLGAALATVAAAKAAELPGFDLRGLYTYGSPLVGDAAFKRYFEGLMRDRFGIEHYRFVYERDIVTSVPPAAFGFVHAGTLKHIRRGGAVLGAVGASESLRNFLAGLFRRSFDASGSVHSLVAGFIPEQLKDHVPTFYTTNIWNAHVREAG